MLGRVGLGLGLLGLELGRNGVEVEIRVGDEAGIRVRESWG